MTETIKALETYRDKVNKGLEDTTENWQLWRRAFQAGKIYAQQEVKKMKHIDVAGSLPITKTCFFELKNKKYITENGIEITTEMLIKHKHSIMGNSGFIILD